MKLHQDKPANIDEEIDAALQLLREVQPPAAMESRVHQSLEAAAAKPRRARSGGLFWIPVAGAAIMAVLLVAFLHGDWMTAKHSHAVETAKTTTAVPARAEIAPVRTALVSTAAACKRKPAAQAVAVRRIRRKHPQYRHVANLLSYPLTRQEKLLVRFAQTASPADLQALNPEYQAKVEAQQDAEFAAYLKSGDDSRIRETSEAAEKN